MAAAAVSQPPLLPATAPITVASPANRGPVSGTSSKPKTTIAGKDGKIPRGRRERPCDACRRRKSKCVTKEGPSKVCTACGVHGQECTYLEDPQPRKRKVDTESNEGDPAKRR